MMKLVTVVAVAAVSFSALTARVSAAGAMVGYISDTKCATSGSTAKTAAEWIKPAAFEACVKDCVKEGSPAVFVTEDNKILTVDAASADKIKAFLGHKVRVTGTVSGSILKVDKISPLKMQ